MKAKRLNPFRAERAGSLLLAAAVAVTVVGCGTTQSPVRAVSPSQAQTATRASSSPTSTPMTSASSTSTDEQAALAELQSFLDSWRTQGLSTASHRYLAPELQVDATADGLKLTKGRIVSARPHGPTSGGAFTLDVTLDLAFDGSSGAWGNGTNERFVTFTHRSGEIPFSMAFATSP